MPSGSRPVRVIEVPASTPGRALLIHGGANGRVPYLDALGQGTYAEGLQAAYLAGETVLHRDGQCVDAVCAAVCALEDDPVFNCGRGAALTAAGHAELDSAVMRGDGVGGAVIASRHARHPVLLARAVLERSEHVILSDPPESLVREWGLEVADPEWFVTDARRAELADVLAQRAAANRHGTVGAVTLDGRGHLAAATSTGGIVAQATGRVGDSPILDAGTFACDGVVAVSCTGEGEAFLQGVVSHDVYARMAYGHAPLADAVRATLEQQVGGRGAFGGIIALAADGTMVVASNADTMFAAWRGPEGVIVLTE